MEIRASAEFEERITCAVDERLVAATRGASYMRLSKTNLQRPEPRDTISPTERIYERRRAAGGLTKIYRPETRPHSEID